MEVLKAKLLYAERERERERERDGAAGSSIFRVIRGGTGERRTDERYVGAHAPQWPMDT